MKTSGFNRWTVWIMIICIVGSAIVFIASLMIVRVNGRCFKFRKIKGEDSEKITLEQLALGISCVIFPVIGWGAVNYLGCPLDRQALFICLGFLIAIIILVCVNWRMEKRNELKDLTRI